MDWYCIHCENERNEYPEGTGGICDLHLEIQMVEEHLGIWEQHSCYEQEAA